MKTGDIYKLGNHLLGCGSSLDKAFVDKVITVGGVQAVRAIVSDPPYGIAYVEGTQGIKSKQRNALIGVISRAFHAHIHDEANSRKS